MNERNRVILLAHGFQLRVEERVLSLLHENIFLSMIRDLRKFLSVTPKSRTFPVHILSFSDHSSHWYVAFLYCLKDSGCLTRSYNSTKTKKKQ